MEDGNGTLIDLVVLIRTRKELDGYQKTKQTQATFAIDNGSATYNIQIWYINYGLHCVRLIWYNLLKPK